MLWSIVRAVLGVLLGIIAMFIVITAVQYAGHQLFPPPSGLDPRRMEDLSALVAQQSLAALGSIVFAWVLGAFAGGGVAARVSHRWPRSAAVAVSLVVVLGVVEMIRAVPGHPAWMAAAGLLLPVPAALFAARLARRRATATKDAG